jgi:hypothetical protein
MSNFLEQIQGAIRATAVRSASAYSWFGKPSLRLASRFQRALNRKVVSKCLLSTLQSQLYADFYCQGVATPSVKVDAPYTLSRATPFVEELSASNMGTGYWAEGWEVRISSQGQFLARREGLEFRVRAEDCSSAPTESTSLGTRLSLRFPKELLGISPGFYMATSDVEMPRATLPAGTHPNSEDQQLLRFYWNLRAAGAAPLMRSLTSELNRAGLPFNFKVVNAPSAFTRCDAGVLYVRKSDYEAVSGIVRLIYCKIEANLNQRVPAFTKRLAPGLGLAEDPGRKLDSFGLHRCRLLAEGLIRASRQRNDSLPHRLQVVSDHFAKNGISLEKPFLSPGSKDVYHFELPKPQLAGSAPAAPTPDLPDPNPQLYLDTAAQIAWRLTQEAIWHEGRCNWVGFLPIERSLTPQYNSSFSAMGPDLYSGTSGLALFLAELYRATGNAEARRTALGAIWQALSRVDALPLPARPGLFSGWVGIGLVAARVGKILQQEDLLRAAWRLARRCTREKLENWEFDLFYGKAGTIVGLVLLSDLLDKPALLEACVSFARKLLRAADKSEAGYSWKSSAMPSSRNLTGFSHGAAGIGYALLELFHSTRDLKYRRAAEAAFRYERHWYDPRLQNWPDLREEPGQPRPSRKALPFMTAWCHGAPGIALSRLRAYEILKDTECKSEAIVALRTTRKAVESSLHSGNANYSLCHGLAGNADVLLHGNRILGREAGDAQEAAVAVAANGIKRYRDNENRWPCGSQGGETPGLMLGLAGIGYFYLRLSSPSVPPTLISEGHHHQPVG